MRAVFGHPFSILWFSPLATPEQGKAETYQYVVWERKRERERERESERSVRGAGKLKPSHQTKPNPFQPIPAELAKTSKLIYACCSQTLNMITELWLLHYPRTAPSCVSYAEENMLFILFSALKEGKRAALMQWLFTGKSCRGKETLSACERCSQMLYIVFNIRSLLPSFWVNSRCILKSSSGPQTSPRLECYKRSQNIKWKMVNLQKCFELSIKGQNIWWICGHETKKSDLLFDIPP